VTGVAEQLGQASQLAAGGLAMVPLSGSLHDFLEATVARHAGRVAVTDGPRRLSYVELASERDRLAAGLCRAGVRAGDRVALVLPNCAEYVVACFAVLRLGAVLVQVNPLYTGRELTHILADSGASGAIVHASAYQRLSEVRERTKVAHVTVVGDLDAGLAPGDLLVGERQSGDLSELASVPAPARQDLASLQYTGGTTGVSKGAMLTHGNLLGAIEQTCRLLMAEGAEPPPGSAAVAVAPFFHIFGFTMVLLVGLRHGWNLLCVPRFDPADLLELIRQERPAALAGVATLFTALASHPEADHAGLEGIELYISGGAPVPAELSRAFRERFGRDIWEGYGMSEGAPLSFNTYRRGPRPGSVGVPVPGTEARIVDLECGSRELPPGEAGELLVRGPQVMQGYWRMPAETEQALRDGWLHTGDVAAMNEEGFLFIVDRKKDMINTAGFKVYPREIEEVLYEHPAVLEAVAVGVPDSYRGETVKAFVVPKPGQSVTEEELLAHCRESLAAYKLPRQIELRDELPKSAVGKLLRRLLADEQRATESAR
jgi:long-chain acyl-CoA synthetase